MNVVQNALIQVSYEKLLTGLESYDVIFVDAVAEAQRDGLLRNRPLLWRKPRRDDDEDVREAVVFSGDEEAGRHGSRMFGGASSVHRENAFLGPRAKECGATGNA